MKTTTQLAPAVLLPGWVLAPLAGEALLEALGTCGSGPDLRAAVLPLRAGDEEEVSALLARVTSDSEVVHQRPYPTWVWCVGEYVASRSEHSTTGGRIAVEESSRSLYALPPVTDKPLGPLLAGAEVYGEPGLCPAVFRQEAWQSVVTTFREGLPDESMLVLRGSLCRDPETGQVFTYVEHASPVTADAAPDAVSATPHEVIDSLMCGAGQFVGIAHCHPVSDAKGRVIVSATDLATFRSKLRHSHMISLIANVAEGGSVEPIALSWLRGNCTATGFYIAAGGVSNE